MMAPPRDSCCCVLYTSFGWPVVPDVRSTRQGGSADMDRADSMRDDENMRRSEKARIGGRRTTSAAILKIAPASPVLGSATTTAAPAAAAAASP